MGKNILLLEDNPHFVKALKETFSDHQIRSVDNLPVFDSAIYHSPGVGYYDLILMDLALNVPEDIIKKLREDIPDLFSVAFKHKEITQLDAQIHLYGWDYYQRVVRHRDMTRECANSKFVLISGHTALLKKKALYPEKKPSNVILLDKGTTELYDTIHGLLENSKKSLKK